MATLKDIVQADGLFCDGDWIEKKDQNPNGSVRLIQLADIGDGIFKDKSSKFVTEDTAERLHCTFLEKGDILIARLPDPLGRACIFPLSGKYITAVDVAILRIHNPKIDSRFVMHMINSHMFRSQIANYESGTTRKRISRRNLEKIQFNLPSIDEQKLTASYIDKLFSELDKGVETLQTIKEQLAVYRQAVLTSLYPEMTEENTVSLDAIADITSGITKGRSYYSAEEMGKLFEAAQGHKLELIIQLAAFYGLRRAEVMGLRWEAIDFEAKTLTIRHIVTSTRIDGKKILVEADRAKTKSSLRTLPLVDPIAERLKAVKEQQEYNQKICGNCYNHEYLGYVFVDAMGNLIQPDSVTTGFPQLLKENGLRRIRFHDLRHSCASLLLKEGVPMKQIQEWLGHSDISTTANIYAHLDSQSKNLSARTMANTLTLPEAQPIKKW